MEAHEQELLNRQVVRVTELQADNTKLLNELRMVKAQLNAAKIVMRVGFIERPMSKEMPVDGSASPDLVELYTRMELLEKDAWTQTGALARQFIKDVKAFEVNEHGGHQDEFKFITMWRDKFSALIGDT